MTRLSAPQLQMLRHIEDGDPTDYADFADRAAEREERAMTLRMQMPAASAVTLGRAS